MFCHPERVKQSKPKAKDLVNPYRVGNERLIFPRVIPWAEIGQRLRRKATEQISSEFSHGLVRAWDVYIYIA